MSEKETPPSQDSIIQEQRKREFDAKIAKFQLIGVAITALCGLVGVIIASALNPDVLGYIKSTPTTAIIETLSLPLETSLTINESFPTSPATETITPYPTLPPPTSTEASLETMKAELSASASSVKLGSTVNFNARNSYVTFANGSSLTCVNHSLCTFSWTIYHQETSSRTYLTSDGFLSHAFDKRGNYAVTVYVCRGNACNFASTAVNVR
jgi:hypothetical protein